MPTQKSYSEFAADIKTKYPAYKDVDDKQLAQDYISKYPAYKDMVSFDDNPSQPTSPLSPEEAKKTIYGNIPGATKIGDVSLPTDQYTQKQINQIKFQNDKGTITPQQDLLRSAPVNFEPTAQIKAATDPQLEEMDKQLLTANIDHTSVNPVTLNNVSVDKGIQQSVNDKLKPVNIPTNTYDPEQYANEQQEQRELNAPAFSNDNLKHLYKVFNSSVSGMAGSLGKAVLHDASAILANDPYTVHDKEYDKLQGNLSKSQTDLQKWQTKDAPKLKGTFGEGLVSTAPMIGLIGADLLSGGSLTPAVTATFAEMGRGEAFQALDDWDNATDEKGQKLHAPTTEAQRQAAAVGYMLAYTLPVGKYLDKYLVKGAGKYVMSKVLTSNPEMMIKAGTEIIEAAAKQNPSLAAKIIKTSMSSALHGVGTMEAIDLVKMATDKVVIGKGVSRDEFLNRIGEQAKSGFIFGMALAPAAAYANIKGNIDRRNAQGELRFTIDEKGKSVEILPNKEGKPQGIRPDGSIVDVTQSMMDNSFTITTNHFNEVVKGYKKGITLDKTGFERDAYNRRVEQALGNVSSKTDGTITTITDSEGKNHYFTGVDKEGNLTGVDGEGNAANLGYMYRPEIKVGDEIPNNGKVIAVDDKTVTIQPLTIVENSTVNHATTETTNPPVTIPRSTFDEIRWNDPEAKVNVQPKDLVHKSIMSEYDKRNNYDPRGGSQNAIEGRDVETIVNPTIPEGVDPTDPINHIQSGVSVIQAQQAMDKALEGADFTFKHEITELDPEEQKTQLELVLSDEALTDIQKQSIIDYMQKAAVSRQLHTARQAAITNGIEQQRERLQVSANKKTGTLVFGNIKGDNNPIQIQGVALKADENNPDKLIVDVDNSDETVAYKTGNLNSKGEPEILVTTPDQLDITSSLSVDDHINALQQQAMQEEELQQQAIQEQIQLAVGNQNQTPSNSPQGGGQDSNPLTGISNGDTVNYIDNNGDQQSGTIQIDPVLLQEGKVFINDEEWPVENVIPVSSQQSAENPSASLVPLESGQQEGEVAAVAPQYPILKDGTPDFEKMTDAQIYDHTKETEGEEAAQFLVARQVKRLQQQIADNQRNTAKLTEETNKLLAKSKTMQEDRAITAKQTAKGIALSEEATTLATKLKDLQAYLPKVETPAPVEQPKVVNTRPEILQLQKEQAEKAAKEAEAVSSQQSAENPVTTESEQPTETVVEQPTEKVTTEFKQRIANLDGYVDMEDYILQAIAGGQKFKWKGGLGNEFRNSNKERIQRINYIDETNGLTPTEFAHAIYNDYGENGNNGEIPGVRDMSDGEIADLVNEVLRSTKSNAEALRKAESKRNDFDMNAEDFSLFISMTPEQVNYVESIPDDILESYLGITNFTPEQLDIIQNIKNEYYANDTQPAQASASERPEGLIEQEPTTEQGQSTLIVYKRLSEPSKPLSEMNSDEIYKLAVENKKLLKEQDKLFKGKTEAEKEQGGYYNAIDDVSELKDTSTKLNFVENAEDLNELTISAKSILDEIKNKLPNEYQQAILTGIQKRSNELGISANDLIGSVAKKIASQYADSNDAMTMVSSLFDKIATENSDSKQGIADQVSNDDAQAKIDTRTAGESQEVSTGLNASAETQGEVQGQSTEGQPLTPKGEQQVGSEQSAGNFKAGDKVHWDMYGNEPIGEWTVTAITKTRGGQDALELTRFVKEGVARNGGDAGKTQIFIVPLSELKSTAERHTQELDNSKLDTKELDAYIAEQAHNTNPTEKQKETGIYAKARVNLQHHNITIETLKGTERSGIDEGGQRWSVTMNNHYGELDGTVGYDNDPIDVFIGPNPKQGQIFVVDQISPDGSFDESKVMLGFDSAEEAKAAYMSNYSEGWDGFKSITPAGATFKEWLYDGKKQKKPFAEYKDTPSPVESEQLKVDNSGENSDGVDNFTLLTPSQRFDNATTPEERHTAAVEVVKELEKTLYVGTTPAQVIKTTDEFLATYKSMVSDADYQKALSYLLSGQQIAAVRLGKDLLINVEHNADAAELADSYLHETAHKAFAIAFQGEDLSDVTIPNVEKYIPSVYWGEDNAMKATEVAAHQVAELLNNYTPEQIKNGEIDLSLLDEDVQYLVSKTLNKITHGKISIIGQEQFNDLKSIPGSSSGIRTDEHAGNDGIAEAGSNQPDNGKPGTERERILREKLEKLRGKLGLNEKPEYKRYEIPKDFKDNLGIRRELSGGVSLIENFPNEETLYQWEEKRLPELVSEALGLVENVRKGKYLDQEEIGNLTHIFMQARKHNYDGWDNSDVENVYSILVHEGIFKPLQNKEKFDEIYQNIRKQVKPEFKRLDPETTEIALDVTEMLFEDGDIAFADYSARMIDALGEGIKPYLSGFYELSRASIPAEGMTPAAEVANFDIKNFNHKEYVSNRSGRSQQNSPSTNEVPTDANLVPGNGSGSGSVGTGSPKSGGKTSRRPSGTSRGSLQPSLFGEQSDNDLLPTESAVEKPITGDTDGRGNGIDSTEGHTIVGGTSESGNKADVGVPETFKQRTARKIIEQRNAESIPVTLMDEANIRETLPLLLPEQQDDVLKAENRFFGEQHKTNEAAHGKGMLFTNGTGTGKTYTGLGIAKRFDKQGKKNILIVVPSEAKIGDWVKDGENIGLRITPLASTKDAGENAVITTYANFRANEALKDRDFDLVMYDESHRLMEEKSGATSSTTNSHYAHSNVSEWQAFNRLQSVNPEYLKIKYLEDRIYNQRLMMGNLDMMQEDYLDRLDKVEKMQADVDKLQKNYNENIKPGLQARAKAAYENTKVVFLSATPFKGHFNLKYANGSLFDWGNETITNGRGSRVNPEAQFYLNNFGSAYEWKFHRLQTKRNSNAEAIAMQEVEFSQRLMAQGVMSGRAIESDKDYSREFPLVALDKSEVFNQALNEIYSDEFGELSEAAHKVFSDYNYTTKLFESLKASMNIQRIQQHLDLGRKVIVFHRRKQANVLPPFQSILDQTRQLAAGYVTEAAKTDDIAKKAELIHKANEMRKQSAAFETKYADLLRYEQTLNYDPAINQISEAFPGRVVTMNGDTPKKDKSKNVALFNDDNSGKDIFIVQEEAGKEGISLHDTTGKHQRVLISLSLPISSTTALQIEGRPYRIGNESDAIFEYPLLGLDQEISDFGSKINKKLSTTENLAIGDQARDLLRSFAEGVLFNSGTDAPHTNQGKGGKEYDKKAQETLSEFRKAVLVYNTNQKTTGRRDQREGTDYYATPEPVGQKMVEWLGLQAQERALEPSAGHGAIAMWFPEKSNVTVVEPSYKLFSKLNARAGGGERKMINDIFENLNIINKFNGIAMNPPFGSGGKTAIEHVSKAFDHLYNNGRIVAIIPQGQADGRLDKFLEETPNAHLIASIKLPTSTFEQAGTKVGTRIVVIDRIDLPTEYAVKQDISKEETNDIVSGKRVGFMSKEEKATAIEKRMNEIRAELPRTENVDLSGSKNIDELFDDIEDLSVAPRKNTTNGDGGDNGDKSSPVATATDGKFEQFEQKHSKTGEQTYMVSPKEFFDRDTYNKLVSIAKNNEGYFSSYSNKAQNIRSGFTFKTQEDANKFKIDAEREVQSERPEFKMIPNTDFDKEIEVEKKRYNGDSFEIKDDTLHTTHYRISFETPYSTEHIYDGIDIDDAIRGAKWDTNDYDWDGASVGINATHLEIPIEKVKKHFEEEGYEDFDINSDLDYSELNDYINSIDTYDYTKDEDYYTYSNSIADNKTSDELIYEVQSELKNRFGKYIGKYSTVYVNKEGEITADSSDDEGNDNTPVSIRIADHTHNPRNGRSDVTVVIANKNKTEDKFRGAITDLEFDEEYSSDEIANEIEQFIKDNFEYGSKPEYKIIPEKPEFTPEKPIHQYATEIHTYNEKIKAIEDRKKALKKQHDDKTIDNVEFVKQAQRLNLEKADLETRRKRIEAGTSKPEDFETVSSQQSAVSSEKQVLDSEGLPVHDVDTPEENKGSVVSGNTFYLKRPQFKDFNGDLIAFTKEIDNYNRLKREETNKRREEALKAQEEPKLKDFVGRPYSDYESAVTQYLAANRVMRKEPIPENKKEYRNLARGLKTAKDEIVAGDIPGIRELYKDLENEWLGNRDVEKAKAMVEVKGLQERIKETAKGDNIKWQDIDKAMHVYIDMKSDPTAADKYYDGLTPDQQRIIDIARNLTPEQQAIADEIAKSYEDLGKKALEEEVISSVLDNYVRRKWDLSGEHGRDYFAKFSTTTSHNKHRKLTSIIEGWAGGLELQTEGATNNLQALKEEINAVIQNKKVIKIGMDMKGENGVPLFTLQKETGYEEVRHPNFRKWVQQKNVDATNDLRGENWVIDKDGKVFEKKKIYAPEPIAQRINNILGSYDNTLNGPVKSIVGGLDKFNAVAKSTLLSFSFYHHQAFARQYMFGSAFNKPSDANLFGAYKAGFDLFMNMAPEVEMLIRNGMTVGRIQDWQEDLLNQKGMIGKTLDKWNVTKNVQDFIHNVHDRQTQFLFNYYGVGLKVKMATSLLHEQMAKFPQTDPNQLAKEVGEFANNSFGGLNTERFARSKKIQKWLHRIFLAPDWTESNLKALLKTIGFDYSRFGEEGYSKGFNNDKEQAKRERRLYQKLFTKSIVRSNVISAIWNMLIASSAMALLSDDDKDSWLDEIEKLYTSTIDPLIDFDLDDESFMSGLRKVRDVAVKSHFSDADITFIPKAFDKMVGKEFDDNTKYYFSTAGHFKDPAKWIIDPATSAKHKASIVLKFALDGITGKDWQGKRFTTIDEFLGMDDKGIYEKSVPKKGIHVGDPKGGRLALQTVKFGLPYDNGAVQLNELPSFLINEVMALLPVPVHNATNLFNGELDAFTTMTRGLGMNVSSETMKDHEQLKYDRIAKEVKNNDAILKSFENRYDEAIKSKDIGTQAEMITKHNQANTTRQQTLNDYTKAIKEMKIKLPDAPQENQEKISEKMEKLKKQVIVLDGIKDEKLFNEKLNEYKKEDMGRR